MRGLLSALQHWPRRLAFLGRRSSFPSRARGPLSIVGRTTMSSRRSGRTSSRLEAAAQEKRNDTVDSPSGVAITKNGSSNGTTGGKASASRKSGKSEMTTKAKKNSGPSKRKAPKVEESTEDDVQMAPQTPKKRQKSKGSMVPPPRPPITPTPSAVGLMSTESSTTPKKPRRPRRVEPHATNAPLQTPGGSRLVTYPSELFEMTSSQAATADTINTENLLQKACEHLVSIDPRLKTVIDKHHCRVFSPEGLQEEVDPFVALSSSIISQQVSGAAAASIKRKFIELFPSSDSSNPKNFPTPTEVAAADLAFMRTAGLSQRKAEYIKGLAEKFTSGELSAKMLIEATDEELLEKLIAVRGLGRWSVEMFACFALKRTDIFSTGDLGVQRGLAVYLGKDVSKLKNKGGKWKYVTEEDMISTAAKFVPYRSLFMWYMWRMEDVNLVALEGS